MILHVLVHKRKPHDEIQEMSMVESERSSISMKDKGTKEMIYEISLL